MKSEFINIIKEELEEFDYKEDAFFIVSKFIDSYLSELDSIILKFNILKKEYNYNKLNSWSEFPEIKPQISLFRDSGELNLRPCIDYDGSIAGINNKALDPFLKSISINLDKVDFEDDNDESYFFQDILRIQTNIFYTFVTKAWISSDGERIGLPVNICQNGSGITFYLNDLAWNNSSNYRYNKDVKHPTSNEYPSSITLATIYDKVTERLY